MQEPTSVLWPGGDERMLTDALQDNEVAPYDGDSCVAACVRLVREHCARAVGPVRVLEVGAGRGGLTWPLLDGWDRRNVYYHLTDVSAGLVRAAERRAEDTELTDLGFDVLDVAQDPVEQGFVPGSYDLVLAYNVLHLADSAATAIDGLRRLLTADGRLCVIEPTTVGRWTSMLWGSAPGWWNADGRPKCHDRTEWLRLLADAGTTPVACYPEEAADHTLFVAASGDRGEEPLQALRRQDPELARPGSSRELLVLLSDHPGSAAASSEPVTLPPDVWRLGRQVDRAWLAIGDPEGAWRAEDSRRMLETAAARAGWHRLEIPGRDGGADAAAAAALRAADPPAVLRAAFSERSAPTVRDRTSSAGDRRRQVTAAADGDGDITSVIAQVWRELLGTEVGAHDNFFDLGGDSLVAVTAVDRTNTRVGVPISVPEFLEHPTPAGLAALVAERQRAASSA